MNVVTRTLTIVSSTDPSKVGRKGTVLMESCNMLTLDVGGRKLAVEKKGSAFQVSGSREVLTGSDVAGRLEDRLGKSR